MTRVLICEDDPLQAIDLADAVAAYGGQVCACVSSSVDALAAAKSLVPDVAMIDLTLADGKTGVDLAVFIARLGCRVIVLSGSAEEHPKLGRISHSFVSKPVRREIVAELMRVSSVLAR